MASPEIIREITRLQKTLHDCVSERIFLTPSTRPSLPEVEVLKKQPDPILLDHAYLTFCVADLVIKSDLAWMNCWNQNDEDYVKRAKELENYLRERGKLPSIPVQEVSQAGS